MRVIRLSDEQFHLSSEYNVLHKPKTSITVNQSTNGHMFDISERLSRLTVITVILTVILVGNCFFIEGTKLFAFSISKILVFDE